MTHFDQTDEVLNRAVEASQLPGEPYATCAKCEHEIYNEREPIEILGVAYCPDCVTECYGCLNQIVAGTEEENNWNAVDDDDWYCPDCQEG